MVARTTVPLPNDLVDAVYDYVDEGYRIHRSHVSFQQQEVAVYLAWPT